MSIDFRVLGGPGKDNALWVQINKGYQTHRLLFDCGENCLVTLEQYEVQAIEQLFFSHLHMDHVGGFDAFFRANFNRSNRPNSIWGPPETARILQHRFQGYLWNLRDKLVATWNMHDVHDTTIERFRCEAREAFMILYHEETDPRTNDIIHEPHYTVEALTMDHLTPSLAYVVRESPRINVNEARLAERGLRPGAWLKYVKEVRPNEEPTITIDDIVYDMADLRTDLIVQTPGESIAYLTDFLLDDVAIDRLSHTLQGCTTIVCECQYRNADQALAEHHHHMYPTQVATLAQRAGTKQLVLMHVSERYDRETWKAMLDEVRAIYPSASYPAHWGLDERPET